MIFSSDLVVKARNSKRENNIAKTNNATVYIESYFFKSLNTILEQNKKINAVIYEIAQSNNDIIDYKKTTIDVFKNLVDSINNMYFSLQQDINKIKNNSVDITNKNEISPCRYTNLGVSLNNNSFRTNINSDYRILIDYLDSIKFNILYKVDTNIKTRIDTIDSDMEKIREDLIPNMDNSNDSNWGTNLYNNFRSADNESEDLDINKVILLFKKDKDDIINAAKSMIEQLKNTKFPEINGITSETVRLILADYLTRCKDICNIYLEYYSAKQDALREYIAALQEHPVDDDEESEEIEQ